MTRTSALALCWLLVVHRPGSKADPVSPIVASPVAVDKKTTVTDLLAEVRKQTGLSVEAGPIAGGREVGPLGRKPFWQLLDDVAAATGTHVSVNGSGQRVTFAAGVGPTGSCDGAFRTSLKAITAKLDAATGRTAYTASLDVHWEPRFPVFRIDAQPRVTAARDDLGIALAVRPVSVKSAVTRFGHTCDVPIDGLTRKATTIARLTGEFTVTAAPRMLRFAFEDLGTLPARKELDGVTASVTKIVSREEVWEIQVAFEYPKSPPAFESFESWTNRNTLQLLPPRRTTATEPVNSDVTANDRTITAAYRFDKKAVDLTGRKGWGVVCETPAPLVEFPVKFDLKDLKLP